MMVSKITKGDGYIKFLFRGKLLDDKEISIIFWNQGAQSPPHNHSVNEKTFVILGRISETRRYGIQKYRTISYGEGASFDVMAGAEHIVKAEITSVTLNVCYGTLHMDILKDFKL